MEEAALSNIRPGVDPHRRTQTQNGCQNAVGNGVKDRAEPSPCEQRRRIRGRHQAVEGARRRGNARCPPCDKTCSSGFGVTVSHRCLCPTFRRLSRPSRTTSAVSPVAGSIASHAAESSMPAASPHRMADYFVPGLHDLSQEDSLLPTTWSGTKPVRLVTARTILLAATTRFSDDPQGSFSMIRVAGGSASYSVERWFSGLPSYSQDFWLGPPPDKCRVCPATAACLGKISTASPGFRAAGCGTRTKSSDRQQSDIRHAGASAGIPACSAGRAAAAASPGQSACLRPLRRDRPSGCRHLDWRRDRSMDR